MLPASPRKMDAGGKLNRKKPSSVPEKTIATNATSTRPVNQAITANVPLRIIPTDVASPSMPSIKLTELIAPRYQNNVMGIASSPSSSVQPKNCTRCMIRPLATRIAEAIGCPSSFCLPRSLKWSSVNPTATIVAQAASSPPRCHQCSAVSCSLRRAQRKDKQQDDQGRNKDGNAASQGGDALVQLALPIGPIGQV